jgi:DNA-binding beta-propeller fold protein YncE
VNRREFIALAAVAPTAVRSTLVPRVSALVTCDAEARLAVVDLESFRVRRHIATLDDPRSIERVGRAAVVCHTAAGAVSIVDGSGVRHVIRGFVEPRYTAAHPDGVHAFVTDSGRSGVAVVDTVHGVVERRVRLPGWARHITIDRAGNRLWIGLGSAAPHVAVVDTHPFRHSATLTPGFLAHDVGHAPDGHLWVTGGAARELAVATSRRPAGAAPQHVTFSGRRAYVTSGADGSFHVHALDGNLVRTASIPIGSYNVQYGLGRVITPSLDHGTLAVLDSRGVLLSVVHVATSCHDACFLP